MISLFPDRYRPESQSPVEPLDAAIGTGTSQKQQESRVAVADPLGSQIANDGLDIARLRAGVLLRLGMDEDRIAAELCLPHAEVRFLFKLERLRLAARSQRSPEAVANFPQAEAGICDSSTVHLAERGY